MGAIDNFISTMGSRRVDGFARPARYEVQIYPPNKLESFVGKGLIETTSLLCDSITMPGHDLQSSTIKFGTGVATEMVVGHGFEGTIEATFYLDSELDIKSYFDFWQESAIGSQTGTNIVNYYEDDNGAKNYVGSMKIYQLSSKEVSGGKAINRDTIGAYGQGAEGPRNEHTRHEMHSITERTYGIEVFEVYPATIGQIEYAYGTVDELAKLSVSFQYKKWNTILTEGEMGDPRN